MWFYVFSSVLKVVPFTWLICHAGCWLWWIRHSGSNQASHSLLDKMHFFLFLVKYCMWSWVVLLHLACTELNWKIKNHPYKMCVKRSIYNCLVIHQLNSPCLDSCPFFVMKQDSSRRCFALFKNTKVMTVWWAVLTRLSPPYFKLSCSVARLVLL